MRLLWTDAARRDVRTHLHAHAERNLDAARMLTTTIETAVSRLRDVPKIGRPGKVGGTRELVIAGTPFIVVYGIVADDIELYHFRQG